MALVKSRTAITQMTATGLSTVVSVAASYRHSCYVRHANGTGTITAPGAAVVQARPSGSSTWSNVLTLVYNSTASSVETSVVPLPDDAAEVRIHYTAPTGSTGHTLDAEVGLITSY